ncbi:MAG: hypothetical protein LBJ72_11850, partial [Dysgonamonadaceae bacterium]|nr:hypothetical protein [Dysgonamonadaceae bacterium]
MATILQQPDTLSLSGNIRTFELHSAAEVRFTLRQGAKTLIDENYFPGPGGLITIDVKDIINNNLYANLPGDNLVFQQQNICKQFSAEIDNIPITFRAIRAGVDNPADTPANFLRSNFLTWQPQTKRVTYYQPEFLTYYAVDVCVIKLKAYFSDNTTETISLASPAAGNAYTVNTQYSRIAGLLGNKNPMYYDVWVEQAGSRLTYIQRYISSIPDSEHEEWFLFQNSLGGIDTAKMSGVTDFTNELEHKIALYGEVQEEYFIDSKREYKKNTGILDEYSRKWILDFFVAARKWKISQNGVVRAIVVKSSDVNYTTLETVNDYNFTYSFAEDKPYLNLTRDLGALPDNLIFPVPEELFFLPPRLNEFPRIQLDDETLIPVQSPYDEIWGVTTWGYIHDTVVSTARNTILSALPGIADELEVLLQLLIEQGLANWEGGLAGLKMDNAGYLTYKDNGIKVAWADEAGVAHGFLMGDGTLFDPSKYLRKDIDDIASGQITFEKGWITLDTVRSGLFQEGWSDGFGWQITPEGKAWLDDINFRGDIYGTGKFGTPFFASGFAGYGFEIDLENSSAEMDYLTVRKSMRVYELVVNQLRGSNGSIVVSDFNKLKEVIDNGAAWKCIIDDYDGEMLMNMRIDDIVRCQVFSGNNTKYYLARVTAVGNDYFEIDKTMIEGEDLPAAGDVVCRWNNLSDGNRQGLIYLTSSDSHSPYIDILDGSPALSDFERLRARIGRLDGITDPRFPDMHRYGIYTDSFYGYGELILHSTGESVSTMFSVVEGKIEAEINEIKSLIPGQENNILRNATFSTDTFYWNYSNTGIHAYTVAGRPLFARGNILASKENTTEIIYDSQAARRVLRIVDNTVIQPNKFFNEIPSGQTKFEISFYYRIIRPGTFSIGFQDTEFIFENDASTSSGWMKETIAAEWNGTGDFVISMPSGEVLIYNIFLKVNESGYLIDLIEAVRVELQSGIVATAEEIKLYANQKYTDLYGRVTSEYNAAISVSAQNINLSVSALQNNLSSFKTYTESSINLLSNQISLKVSQTDFSELQNRVSYTESQISLFPNMISSKVSYTDFTGNNITSLINQTADSVKIMANRLDISIGNYNHVRDSESLETTNLYVAGCVKSYTSTTFPTGTQKKVLNLAGTGSELYVGFQDVISDITKTYTFSVYIRVLNYSSASARLIIDPSGTDFTITPSWARISFTAQTSAFHTGIVVYAANANVQICMAQVEDGNIMTNWNPHPDDINSKLQNIAGNLGLGSMAWEDAVEIAKLGSTIIQGGYIKTNLIDVDAIKTQVITANTISALFVNFYQGKIGYYYINSDGLYYGDPTQWNNSSYKQNLAAITPGLIRIQKENGYFQPGDIANMKVGIGDGSDPDITDSDKYCYSSGYFYRQMNASYGDQYYPAVKIISDNVISRDVALLTKGAIVCNGGLIGNGRVQNGDSVSVLDLSTGTSVVVSTTTSRYIYLPTLYDMQLILGNTSEFVV